MRFNKCGWFNRYGKGYFISFFMKKGFLTFSFRLRNWRLEYLIPPQKPWVRRFYFGPFEIERSYL
jgi:hypothetical protein